jgi:hypothetical protein
MFIYLCIYFINRCDNIRGCVDFSQPLFTTLTSLIRTGIYVLSTFWEKDHVFVYMKDYQWKTKDIRCPSNWYSFFQFIIFFNLLILFLIFFRIFDILKTHLNFHLKKNCIFFYFNFLFGLVCAGLSRHSHIHKLHIMSPTILLLYPHLLGTSSIVVSHTVIWYKK